ncbi:MAG TPA: aquaporin [Bacteroidota bacterium]|nr:aquaporin [Bacteroidota bacterium]
MKSEKIGQVVPWQTLVSELVGTGLLVFIGLTVVILMFGTGGPGAQVIPDEGLRRLITGFLFGTTGALIALSPVGRESGAHINPAVTFGFWMMGKLGSQTALGYVLAQLSGAALGALPLLLWGSMGKSVAFGATLPGEGYAIGSVLLGEAVTTFGLVAGLCVFLGYRPLRPFTPGLFPFLYALMVYLEAPLSGTSTNPARSLGPSIISGHWEGWWIYWVGPLAGVLAGIAIFSFLARRIEVAKLYYFESDRRRLFRTVSSTGQSNEH